MADWQAKQRAAMLAEIMTQRSRTADRREEARRNFDATGMARAEAEDRGSDEMERRVKEDWKDYSPPSEAPKGAAPINE